MTFDVWPLDEPRFVCHCCPPLLRLAVIIRRHLIHISGCTIQLTVYYPRRRQSRGLGFTGVCLFYFPQDISNSDVARIIKRDIEMFHHESWKPIYFGVKIEGQGHEAQKQCRRWFFGTLVSAGLACPCSPVVKALGRSVQYSVTRSEAGFKPQPGRVRLRRIISNNSYTHKPGEETAYSMVSSINCDRFWHID